MSDDKQSGKDEKAQAAPEKPAEKPSKLTDLLDEWEASKEAKSDTTIDDPKLEDRIAALEKDRLMDATKAAVGDVIKSLKGDLEVSDYAVKGWLDQQAEDDPRLNELFENRDSRRKEWNEAMKSLSVEFREQAKTDGLIKSDKKLGAAVRASKETQGNAGLGHETKFGSLSDADFQAKKQEIFSAARAGSL